MDKVDTKLAMKELTMALIYLSRRRDTRFGEDVLFEAWKGYEFDVLNELQDENYLIRRGRGSKSVLIAGEGLDYAKQILEKYNISDWKTEVKINEQSNSNS